ncbi:hypothetical protein GCM10018952_71720 [Streptosporangium vulgare]
MDLRHAVERPRKKTPEDPTGRGDPGEIFRRGAPQETEQPEVSGSGAGRPIEGMPSMTPEPAPAGAP